ncbi:thyroid transcription factor 1-associated protein 26 homolog [Ostrinia furnacalis]|uniref:thyroid transcription factor 1-associated protein 26 homolog n=1 Tax=Ostrinia furnacalis TaxID=93504 RepID=UPI001040730F|nr:thyroid transcription factor 1-associated protein 26 homolog [Ostrinia furnacalis]
MEHKRDSFFLNKNKGNRNGFDKKNEKKGGFNNKPEHKGFNRKKEFNNKRQEQFDKGRGIEEHSNKDGEKKPFDKKTYRLKKYSKKYKLEQWEEQRKKKLLREYQKDLKNDTLVGSYKPKGFDEDTTDSAEVGRFVRHPDLMDKVNEEKNPKFTKKDPFQRAKEQFNKVKEEKAQKQQDIEKAKEEKKQKLHEYKKKKQERFKKLSRKTKKGQPVMTGRLELLLEKIQKN